MKPPKKFKLDKDYGYSICDACGKWKKNNRFKHEEHYWILCGVDYADYWENTDKLLADYVGF